MARAGVAVGVWNRFVGMVDAHVRMKVVGAGPVLRLPVRTIGALYMQAFGADLTCIGLTIVISGIWYIVRRNR